MTPLAFCRSLLTTTAILVGTLSVFGQPASLKALLPGARKGEPQAQYQLGRMYENGNGVAENPSQAAKWYRKAADQGLAPAQYSLGRLYSSGEGVTQDYMEAMFWFSKAAAQDYALAQNRLGVMYEKDQGVTRDNVEAYKWFTLAAANGQNIFGVANQDNLGRRMTLAQIQEARSLAAAAQSHPLVASASGNR